MSITKSVSSVANTSTAPFEPAGTITAFAVTVPVRPFSEATNGCGCPAGHAVRYPNGPLGTAAKFNEYACALAGTPQVLERIGNVLVPWPFRPGPPNGPC